MLSPACLPLFVPQRLRCCVCPRSTYWLRLTVPTTTLTSTSTLARCCAAGRPSDCCSTQRRSTTQTNTSSPSSWRSVSPRYHTGLVNTAEKVHNRFGNSEFLSNVVIQICRMFSPVITWPELDTNKKCRLIFISLAVLMNCISVVKVVNHRETFMLSHVLYLSDRSFWSVNLTVIV